MSVLSQGVDAAPEGVSWIFSGKSAPTFINEVWRGGYDPKGGIPGKKSVEYTTIYSNEG